MTAKRSLRTLIAVPLLALMLVGGTTLVWRHADAWAAGRSATGSTPTAQEVAPCTLQVPRPTVLNLSPPGDDLAPEPAAWAGVWEGVWTTEGMSGQLWSYLIVERIDADQVTFVYAVGDDAPGGRGGQWSRNQLSAPQGSELVWQSAPSIRFTFTLADDLESMRGVREAPGVVSQIVYHRCTLASEIQPVEPAP